MKTVKYYILFLLFFGILPVQAQMYWVVFKDKKNTTFNPYEYFSQKAIERRIACGISLYDSTDFPLNEQYVKTVELIVGNIVSESRWINAIAVKGVGDEINRLKMLPFVSEVRLCETQTNTCDDEKKDKDEDLKQLMEGQIKSLEGDLFSRENIDGKGVRIAIFDAGFPDVDKLELFKHLRDNNQIVGTYDFVKNKEEVYKYNSHGCKVLSCIAGIYKGQKTGLATGAEFLLARTEVATEPFSEEENWLAAVEWADKNGADIINSSLGYTHHRYTKDEMDGKTSFVVKAANLAAKKGMLVVNAMGNDGSDDWEFAGTPADADSVLSIGGIDPSTGYHIYFSSFGPTADKRMKPNVSAYGEVAFGGDKKVSTIYGTSFASPLIAGFAACVKQMHPEWSNMELFKEIEKSGSLYPYYDYAHGFGIPQASYFLGDTIEKKQPTFVFQEDNDSITIMVEPEELENADSLLYYHIQNKEGYLKKYAVVKVSEREAYSINKYELKDCVLRVHYQGYTDQQIF